MRKLIVGLSTAVMITALFGANALAQEAPSDGPGTIPDGPVESPPGYTCSASGGRVTCEKIDSTKEK